MQNNSLNLNQNLVVSQLKDNGDSRLYCTYGFSCHRYN